MAIATDARRVHDSRDVPNERVAEAGDRRPNAAADRARQPPIRHKLPSARFHL
jgi:hypothetical protein